MISIIVCSINTLLANKLEKNIAETIGVPYKFVIHNNQNSPNGICNVYNKCASVTDSEYVVFIHEDVVFHSNNWGESVIDYLRNNEIGLLGVAGAIYKTKQAAPWWAVPKHLIKTNIIQHRNGSSIGYHEYQNENPEINDLAVVDGVFMACRKEVWDEFKFDEINFPGFHNYDMDFSLSIGQRYRVVFTDKILLEHFSQGSYNASWIKSTITLHSKWRNQLPISKTRLTSIEALSIERDSFVIYTRLTINRGISLIQLTRVIFKGFKIGIPSKTVITFATTWVKRQFR